MAKYVLRISDVNAIPSIDKCLSYFTTLLETGYKSIANRCRRRCTLETSLSSAMTVIRRSVHRWNFSPTWVATPGSNRSSVTCVKKSLYLPSRLKDTPLCILVSTYVSNQE